MFVDGNYVAFGALIALLVTATYCDIRSHRIPNVITFGGVLAALAMQLWFFGWSGLLAGGGGLATGMVFLLPLYFIGGMAAGDVKLMAAAGAFLGPFDSALASGMALIAGGVAGLAVLVMRGGLMAALSRYLAMGKCVLFTGQLNYLPPAQDEAASSRFPYAAAIAIGVLTVVFWHPFGV